MMRFGFFTCPSYAALCCLTASSSRPIKSGTRIRRLAYDFAFVFCPTFCPGFYLCFGRVLDFVRLVGFHRANAPVSRLGCHAQPESAFGGALCTKRTLPAAPVDHSALLNHVVFEPGAQQ